MPSSRARCPKCGRRFLRLDTHLRVSAVCRDVCRLTGNQPAPPPVSTITIAPPPSTASISNFRATRPGNLNSSLTAAAADATTTPQHLHNISEFTPKPKLRLPKSDEEWEKANSYFKHNLVPYVISELSADGKNEVLTEGVFRYFDANFGSAKHDHQHRQRQSKQQSRLARQVRESKAEKNHARREFMQAKKSTALSQEQVKYIARKFFQSVRSHNACKRAHLRSSHGLRQQTVRHQCRENLWRFSWDLLDNDSVSDIQPIFSEVEATSFFTSIYQSEPQSFSQPSWLPSASAPVVDFNEEDISMTEIFQAVKKSRSKSSPSPVDGIPYTIFKKCPALLVTLHNIFNLCWATSVVPSAWKLAAVKLIGKTSARSDPSTPTNFRPIALTSCVGKLFTAIVRNRLLNFMLSNKYIDKSIQKAFMPATSGCSEHHLKLATTLCDAKRKHHSLAVCWVNLANAYGSVHHSLILHSLRHYHVPSKMTNLVKAFYTGLAASVSSSSWSTSLIPIQVGVYQGDPLSVVIFNTVINTLVDTLQTRRDLGYSYSER